MLSFRPNDQHFRFFDLPLELRNRIYSNSAQGIHKVPGPGLFSGDTLDCLGMCIPELRLVSRQFRAEYEDEVFRTAELTLNVECSMGANLCELLGGVSGYPLHLVRRVVLVLHSKFDWHTEKPDRILHQQLPELLSMTVLPALRTFHLRLEGHLVDPIMLNMTYGIAYETCASEIKRDLFPVDLSATTEQSISRDIGLTQDVIIRTELFALNHRMFTNRRFAEWLKNSPVNVMRYRPNLANEPYSWCGMSLEIVEGNVLDFDEQLRKYLTTRGNPEADAGPVVDTRRRIAGLDLGHESAT